IPPLGLTGSFPPSHVTLSRTRLPASPSPHSPSCPYRSSSAIDVASWSSITSTSSSPAPAAASALRMARSTAPRCPRASPRTGPPPRPRALPPLPPPTAKPGGPQRVARSAAAESAAHQARRRPGAPARAKHLFHRQLPPVLGTRVERTVEVALHRDQRQRIR